MAPDFAAAYDEHVWAIYGFFAYRVRNRADAEDLTQQTFERALRAWHRFDPERGSQGTWLLAIARNLLIDHHRADRGHRNEPIDEVGDERLGSHLADPDLGLEPALAGALAELRPRDREIVALRFGGDLTGAEIADMTGLTLANVQQILSRSLRRLREALDGRAVPESPASGGERTGAEHADRRHGEQDEA
jgi:RNA polymerase sigma-70 factor (ECF subfamily)